MIRFRFRLVVDRLARQYHDLNSRPQRFDILYFGRDEFSCQVFEKLYSAKGCYHSAHTLPLPRVSHPTEHVVLSG